MKFDHRILSSPSQQSLTTNWEEKLLGSFSKTMLNSLENDTKEDFSWPEPSKGLPKALPAKRRHKKWKLSSPNFPSKELIEQFSKVWSTFASMQNGWHETQTTSTT